MLHVITEELEPLVFQDECTPLDLLGKRATFGEAVYCERNEVAYEEQDTVDPPAGARKQRTEEAAERIAADAYLCTPEEKLKHGGMELATGPIAEESSSPRFDNLGVNVGESAEAGGSSGIQEQAHSRESTPRNR